MDRLTDRKKARNAVSNKKRGKTRHTVAWSPCTYDFTLEKPLPPGRGDPPSPPGIFGLQLGVAVAVTDVGDRSTLPIRFLDDDIEVTAALWVAAMGGDGAGIGDTYLLRLEWDTIDARGHVKARESKIVDRLLIESEDDLADPIVMHIPPKELEDIPDDILITVGMLVETVGFDQIFYVPTHFYLDRQAPGGSRLPPLELPLTTLTLAQLRNDLGGKLVGNIADYYDQEPGDTIRIFAQPKAGGASIPVLEVKVTSRDQHTRPEFLEEHLEKLDPAGTYELYYDITDAPGNRSIESPRTDLTVWIKDSPVDMPPPVFPGKEAFDDEILRDPQIRPFMDVEIPEFPGAEAGQTILLVFDGFALDGGLLTINAGTLGADDIGKDPILIARVPFGAFSEYLAPAFGPTRDITAWYEVQKGALPRPTSDTEDATIAAGFTPDPDPKPDPDPEPGKPENPNNAYRAPLLLGESGTANIITVSDNAKQATVTVYWNDSEGRTALKVGDRIQAILDDEPYGEEFVVEDEDEGEDVEIDIDVANPGLPGDALEGRYWLYCELTREVEGEDITIDIPATSVTFQSSDDLPGGGTLAKSYFIAGERKGPGRYAINGSDVVQDNGTDVRCYVDDTKVVRGMTVNWRFEGFLQAGGAAPGAALTGNFVIDDGDLRPRPDDPRDPTKNRAFRDIHIPRANMEAIGGRGSATFEYWITVGAGESRSDKDTIVADIRIPDSEVKSNREIKSKRKVKPTRKAKSSRSKYTR